MATAAADAQALARSLLPVPWRGGGKPAQATATARDGSQTSQPGNVDSSPDLTRPQSRQKEQPFITRERLGTRQRDQAMATAKPDTLVKPRGKGVMAWLNICI